VAGGEATHDRRTFRISISRVFVHDAGRGTLMEQGRLWESMMRIVLRSLLSLGQGHLSLVSSCSPGRRFVCSQAPPPQKGVVARCLSDVGPRCTHRCSYFESLDRCQGCLGSSIRVCKFCLSVFAHLTSPRSTVIELRLTPPFLRGPLNWIVA
jgi:hypothetical protein